jgi:non-specific serine/threonine protein kinase/serine/threonine-protein kinase
MTAPRPIRCPQCGRPRASEAATHGLCPACLFATAASLADEVWPYQVLAPIEQDAQGITYLAERHASSARDFVSLKVVVDGNREAMLSRFRELQPALARLQHPGAAKVLDAGSTPDGSAYVASEYVAGPTLAGMASRHSLEHEARAEIARQMTEAVGAAHAAGVVHLNLDGSKVRVSTAGGVRARITGFGVSVIVADRAGNADTDLAALSLIIGRLDL